MRANRARTGSPKLLNQRDRNNANSRQLSSIAADLSRFPLPLEPGKLSRTTLDAFHELPTASARVALLLVSLQKYGDAAIEFGTRTGERAALNEGFALLDLAAAIDCGTQHDALQAWADKRRSQGNRPPPSHRTVALRRTAAIAAERLHKLGETRTDADALIATLATTTAAFVSATSSAEVTSNMVKGWRKEFAATVSQAAADMAPGKTAADVIDLARYTLSTFAGPK